MATSKAEAVLAVLGLEIEGKSNREIYDIWKQAKEVEAILKQFMDSCKKEMFKNAEQDGVKDEKGSVNMRYDDGKGYQKQARVSMTLNQGKAISFLRSKGMEELISKKQMLPKETDEDYATVVGIIAQSNPDLLETIELVEELDLETAIYDGKIESSDLENLVDKKVTYALVDLDKAKGGSKG